ncbi:uncharacterized protein N7482_008734 [Penicillium canariense]|uniref:Mg2+ transporter protein, CorA-like/Zinc transport protein ZntB n=1 Tax=Penicillium canariense TaxID=189055 RepID=A0A9W9LIM3_9EURO|nr:uncharacterized protein N7482_008734 [Penicillium canariense]KAJ5157634.1 hypothetical protein N7482_008734 [Penicillium canariense]
MMMPEEYRSSSYAMAIQMRLVISFGGDGWREERRVHPTQLSVSGRSQAPDIISPETQVYIIVGSANKIRGCQQCKQALTDAFLIPPLWWADHIRKSNGYFGCEATRDAETTTGLNTWAFFESKRLTPDKSYHWSKINVFTRWLSAKNQTGILIFDLNEYTPHPCADLVPENHLLSDPFWVYPHILNSVAKLEERAVWAIRDQVRPIEKEQEVARPPNKRPQPNYRTSHDIARHAIHVTETLDVALQTVEHILENHRIYMSPGYSNPFQSHHDPQIWQEIQSRLSFAQNYLSSMRHRSSSNEKRLQNEIQLAFHMVAQHDASVTVKISRAMMTDSAALKTLAFVTFTFLPPTFICAVFSMSFFNYDQSTGWKASGKLWIYWAFAIPTTVITALLWNYWHRVPPPEQVQKRVDTFGDPV